MSKLILYLADLKNRVKLFAPNVSALRFLPGVHRINKTYNSQFGQDYIAESLFNDFGISGDLKIIDIGANHPLKINNTFYFENLKNAKVYSFDPNPEFVKLWAESIRTSEFFNIGISSTEKNLDLYIPISVKSNDVNSSDVYGSFSSKSMINFQSVSVSVSRLSNVLTGGSYNLLFIDVEGHESEVLSGIDFNIFSFDIIFIENNTSLRSIFKNREFLKSLGYKLYGRILGVDDIFINSNLFSRKD